MRFTGGSITCDAKNMNKQRITARVYLILSIVFLVVVVFGFVGFVQDKQSVDAILISILVGCLLIFFAIGFLNFVDIFITDDGKFLLEYFGKNLVVERIIKIGKLPAFMRIGATSYTMAWLSFINTEGKKKIKFFMIASNGWYLVEDMKIRGIS
jgi:hypothetical protein